MRKTEVRTTPVRSQQCECQQCEGVNSANETRVRMPTVRMPAVRCDIGAKKVRQQCECQQCESHFFSYLLIEKFNNRVLRLPKKNSLIINITWECKHCGARALDGTIRFRRLKRSRVFSRRCHRSLATCQAMHGDAAKARAGREKTKAMLPRVLTCPFRR